MSREENSKKNNRKNNKTDYSLGPALTTVLKEKR